MFRRNIHFFEDGKRGFDPVERIYYDLNDWLYMKKSNIGCNFLHENPFTCLFFTPLHI